MSNDLLRDPILLAQKLISFPTVTPIDAGIVDFLISQLEPLGFKCEKLVFEDVTNLYARYGEQCPNFCFAGHTDVVPVGENWSVDPFNSIIKNGNLYGRGASDMKAAVASFLSASAEFIQNNSFKGSISFLISGNEEGVAENGTPRVLKYLQEKGEIIDACIVGEPTCAKHFGDIIKNGRRGSISFKLIVQGKQGHVAYPKLADNPIDKLLAILTQLKQLKLDEGSEDFDPSNLEITDIKVGNNADNVIPGQAEAKINIRFNNLHSAASLTAKIEDICAGAQVISRCSAQAFIGAKQSSLIDKLSASVAKVTGIVPVLSTTGGTSDARFIKDYCPVIEFGLLNAKAHQVDEYVAVDDIIQLKAVYLQFLVDYFQG